MPKVKNEECIGCGLCCGSHPDIFTFGDDGKAVVIEGANPTEADVDDAVANCAVGAIEK